MAKNNTRLELTWIGKENRPQLEPRILVEDPEKSYHAAQRVTDNDLFDNRLIFGDNLLALKALEQEFTGKIKCIYIDPPYNTGSAFKHYDDGVEHSIWLSLMRDRLEILRRLLTEDGSIWVNLDDNEAHYCKVLMDELYGRANFLCDIAWEKRFSPPPDTKDIGYVHDHILVYRKSGSFARNLLPLTEEQVARYKNPDNDPRGPWQSADYTCRYTADERPNLFYPIKHPVTGKEVWPKRTRVWAMSKEVHEDNVRNNLVYWGPKGQQKVPRLKNLVSSIQKGMMPMSLWKHTLAGNNQEAAKEMIALFGNDKFSTPKPERLISLVFHIASNPGDWVLDSFAGSGTTGAVAHKMGRRWIMVELGEHCHTHIIPRMKKVIDGEDQGGISKAVDWKGGGGFRYYKLGPSLIVKDEWENPVINPAFNAGMLAEAMCKLEGFTFEPNADIYWQQGRSSEADFIYVTTQMMTKEMLTKLSDEVGPNRSLLVCCGAFKCDTNSFENLTVKKIPKAVLKKCEWGHDDYSLEIRNLPVRKEEQLSAENAEVAEREEKKAVRKFGKGKAKDLGPTLFDLEGMK